MILNLPYTTTHSSLRSHLAAFASPPSILEVHVVSDDLGRSKGYAFVRFLDKASSERVRLALDGTAVSGRIVRALRAKDDGRLSSRASSLLESGLSYKDKKDISRREGAMDSRVGNSATYVDQDAATGHVAGAMGVDKGDVINLEEGGAAARVAIAEAEISEVLVAPTGTTAVVVYSSVGDAKRGFRRMAYARGEGGKPIYIEWARRIEGAEREEGDKGREGKEEEEEEEEEEEDGGDTTKSSTTLFVKNLNFLTTAAELKDYFSSITGPDTVLASTIPTKDSGSKSMGYGFVQFKDAGSMRKGKREGGAKLLEGHKLECKVSEKVIAKTTKAAKALGKRGGGKGGKK
ncbi:hypothetical protein TrRE_jg11472, partial [Triparma retinervis]